MTRALFLYLASHALSLLGNAVISVVLPLLILDITGSPAAAGTLALATMIPSALAGLFGGVLVDRFNRRNISLIADLISAASVVALPLVDAAFGLNLGWFVLLGIVGAVGDLPGRTAREALLPALLRRSNMPNDKMVGIREAISGVVVFLGPAAAGTLMLLLPGATVLYVTAATSFLAALLTLGIPSAAGLDAATEDRPPLTARTVWLETLEGFSRTLLQDRFIRSMTATWLIFGAVWGTLQLLFLPVHFTNANMQESLGFVLASVALGSIIGSVVYAALARPGSRRHWLVYTSVALWAGFLIVLLLPNLWLMLAAAFVAGLASGPINSVIGVLLIERIPEEFRGRVMSSQNALMSVVPALFAFGAGLAVEWGTLRGTAIAFAVFWTLGVAWWLVEKSFYDLEPLEEVVGSWVGEFPDLPDPPPEDSGPLL